MKIAFLIDKTQTFQIIASTLYESLSRGHDCTLLCNFEPKNLGYLINIEPKISEFKNLTWVYHLDKNVLIDRVSKDRKLFDVCLGINLFNKGWKRIYENDNKLNYSLEYCWNEIYNQVSDFKSNTTLFCNSDNTKTILEELSGYQNLESLGSPWFEFLTNFKNAKSKKRKIAFLTPHNSLYIKHPKLFSKVEKILQHLRVWCDNNNFELILKDRQKYNNRYNKTINFDAIESDSDVLSHILLYAGSDIVIHFCSSAINELAFLETPCLSLTPDYQKNLHTDRIHHPGILKLHEKYYSGEIFDGKHSDFLNSDEMSGNKIIEKISGLLESKKDWDYFKNKFFPGDHKNASKRIIDRIEKDFNESKSEPDN